MISIAWARRREDKSIPTPFLPFVLDTADTNRFSKHGHVRRSERENRSYISDWRTEHYLCDPASATAAS